MLKKHHKPCENAVYVTKKEFYNIYISTNVFLTLILFSYFHQWAILVRQVNTDISDSSQRYHDCIHSITTEEVNVSFSTEQQLVLSYATHTVVNKVTLMFEF